MAMKKAAQRPLGFVSLVVTLCIVFIESAGGECMNGCSGHGKCTIWDMCVCARNWQGNDCGDRTCMFGRAWADSPKGDLDSSLDISGPLDRIAVNSPIYPYGTSESYPLMEDSDHTQLDNTAHEYAECSNVGNCDRKTGVCDCQPGYEGSACHRMTCPSYYESDDQGLNYHVYDGKCSGHGVCRTLRNIALHDHKSRYNLWDRDQSTACICDPGYFGGDCHMRACKKDMDPLYLDDVTTMQYGRYYFPLLTTANDATFHNGIGDQPGTFSIIVYDQWDQPFETESIYADSCECEDLVKAVEGLPKGLVPKDSVACQKLTVFDLNPLEDRPAWQFKRMSRYTAYGNTESGQRTHYFEVHPTFWLQGFDSTGDTNTTSKMNPATAGTTDKYISGKIFHMEFLGNYGDLKEPEINIYTDRNSRRPTLHASSGHLFTNVWSDGNRVEGTNHWANHCHDVTVGIVHQNDYVYLTGFGFQEKRRLKKCLGSADHDDTNNGDTSNVNWDHGSAQFPHMIRLVRTVTDVTDSGYYVPIYYDTTTTGLDDSDDWRDEHILKDAADPTYTDGTFKVLIPFEGLDRIPYGDTTTNMVQFEVYTTKGVLQRVGNSTEVAFDFASKVIYTTNVEEGTDYDGNVACRLPGQGGLQNQQNDKYHACINKGDIFFMFDPVNLHMNPGHLNMHRALSVTSDDDQHRGSHPNTMDFLDDFTDASNKVGEKLSVLARYKSHRVFTDIATNWAQEVDGTAKFYMYKFFPHFESTYNYVGECSNRGLCNYFEGECECFPGYTSDSCREQETLTL